ncbi:ABC transporter substrate-binding protein [Pseudactinotalea terrae]|uniref:ABC transporter substrate-binding protein n=1 Tax=Pseudactinotalea terrae TaxID=1743262 RepID=UPI0012E31F30|nr:extracellular solute-binding protein [Pseudactinotalea terrae]
MKDLQRRTFLTAGFGLVTAGALASCSRGGGDDDGGSTGGGDASGSGDAGSASLRVSWYGGQPVHDGMAIALEAFGTDNADVEVATEFAPFGDFWDRLATQTAAGDSPDVFRMSMTYFDEYASRGALLDVGDALANGDIDASGLDEDVAASGTVAGGTFGVGQSSIVFAVFVDPDQLAAAGLEPPANGWTWEEFEALATAYAEATPDGTYGCNDNGGNFQAFEVYARQESGDLFSTDGELTFDAAVVESWLAYWHRLREAGVAPPADVTAETQGFENALFVKNQCAMQWGWVQQVVFYQDVTDASLQVVSVPAKTAGDLSGAFIKALDFWCISATTEVPEQAAATVDFLLNDPRAIEAIGLTLGVPPSKAARDQLAADPESAPGRAIAYVEELTDQVGPPPPAWPTGYSEILSAFARANEQVAFGEADPATAAAGVMTAAESALA